MKRLFLNAALALAIGVLSAPGGAKAQDCYIGEIRMFAGNFAPKNWALLDGQLMQINQNPALFSIIGTAYGGDGRATFGLPDMRGRSPMHAGQGPGLAPRRIGEQPGEETNTISAAQMPPHSHPLTASSQNADQSAPSGRFLSNDGNDRIYHDGPADVALNAAAIGPAGSGQPVNNIQPSLVVSHIICLYGIFPQRN